MSQRTDIGLLMLRLGVGGTLAAHGAQKLFGLFGGGGPEGTGKAMESMGFTPGKPNALAAGLGEAGGVLLALGLATPAAGAAGAATMATAASVHAPNGFFAMDGGLEHPALLGMAAAVLAVTGPGRYSLDHVTGHCLNRPWVMASAFSVCAAATAVVIARRQRAVAHAGDSGTDEAQAEAA
ncbi:DoxX family protein [Streptomyces sp. SL13]|uniref:DoxX family protein n=1 Tax=Streptantibioticus silvisoli TaxID=2705255 RepID=A0AA90KH67_9ACTN|nr:DoxX family protein [Streptantibioticus silvisoli]MDI5971400.1 DoxX family protein [Streptantibioticus silvisoli]